MGCCHLHCLYSTTHKQITNKQINQSIKVSLCFCVGCALCYPWPHVALEVGWKPLIAWLLASSADPLFVLQPLLANTANKRLIAKQGYPPSIWFWVLIFWTLQSPWHPRFLPTHWLGRNLMEEATPPLALLAASTVRSFSISFGKQRLPSEPLLPNICQLVRTGCTLSHRILLF